jgi:hypothetical protein
VAICSEDVSQLMAPPRLNLPEAHIRPL